MEEERPQTSAFGGVQAAGELSTLALLREVTTKAIELARKELELAHTELKQDLRAELSTVKVLGAACVLGIVALTLFLVAGIFALALVMPAWGAALSVAGATTVLAVIAAAIGWSRRVTRPLAITRKSLEEDVEWAREHLA